MYGGDPERNHHRADEGHRGKLEIPKERVVIGIVSPRRSWFAMSLAVRLPLLAGMSVIIACVVTSALGLHFMQRELRHQAQSLVETYLDSL